MKDHSFQDKDMLAKDLLRMLEQGSPNDVKLKLSDGEMSANKDILMARSDYFATMFNSNRFIEGKTSSVDMSHCSKTVMEKIVKFLFSGEIEFGHLSLAQLLELCHMCDMMILEKIEAEVKVHLKAMVIRVGIDNNSIKKDITELISGVQLADQRNLLELKWFIIDSIHYLLAKPVPVDVCESDSFKALSFNLVKDILLRRKEEAGFSVHPTTAMQRLEAFMAWLSKNEATEEQKNEMVESINFDEFTVKELMTSVRDTGFFPAKRIDERVINLFEEKDKLLKEKDKLLKGAERQIQILKNLY